MTNVIPFSAATSGETVRVLAAGSTKRTGSCDKLAAASQDALEAMLAAIDSIGLALDHLDIIHKALPEGANKDLMQQRKAALTVALFASRMLALQLSSELEKLGFLPDESGLTHRA